MEKQLWQLSEQALHRLLEVDYGRVFGPDTVLLNRDTRFLTRETGKPDALFVDSTGRLIAVEAKIEISNEAQANDVLSQISRYSDFLCRKVGKQSILNLCRDHYARLEIEEEADRRLGDIEAGSSFKGWNWELIAVIVAARVGESAKLAFQRRLDGEESLPFALRVIELDALQREFGKPEILAKEAIVEQPAKPGLIPSRIDVIGRSEQHVYHSLSDYFSEVDRYLSAELRDMLPCDVRLRAKSFQNWWKSISLMHPWGLEYGGVLFAISRYKDEAEVRLECRTRADLVSDLQQPLNDARETIARSLKVQPSAIEISKNVLIIKYCFDRSLLEDCRRVAEVAANFIRPVYAAVIPYLW